MGTLRLIREFERIYDVRFSPSEDPLSLVVVVLGTLVGVAGLVLSVSVLVTKWDTFMGWNKHTLETKGTGVSSHRKTEEQKIDVKRSDLGPIINHIIERPSLPSGCDAPQESDVSAKTDHGQVTTHIIRGDYRRLDQFLPHYRSTLTSSQLASWDEIVKKVAGVQISRQPVMTMMSELSGRCNPDT
jgi:hypothetical protein